MIARAPANGGRTYPNAEVVLLDCALDGLSAGGLGRRSAAIPRRCITGNTTAPISATARRSDVHARHPASKRLTMPADTEAIANYSNPAWVLGGWSPLMAPIVLREPASSTATRAGAAEMSVTVAGIPEAAYQWFRNGAPIAGATSRILSFAAVRSADAGVYTVQVTNGAGTTTSRPATLSVK